MFWDLKWWAVEWRKNTQSDALNPSLQSNIDFKLIEEISKLTI